MRKDRGIVLVLVLVVLALAGMAMTARARHSAASALEANAALERLQVRWGRRSLASALAGRVESVLAAFEREDPEATATRRVVLTLNGRPLELIFCDEQAKADANLLYRRGGPGGLEEALRRLIEEPQSRSRILLRPSGASDRAARRQGRPFVSYDQLLQACPLEALAGSGDDAVAAAEQFTCWSDGRLNVRRCGREALRQAAGAALNEYEQARLLELCLQRPGASLADLLRGLELDDRRREAAAALLTDASACHALWIVQDGGRRRWYSLAVSGAADGWDGTLERSFAW